MVLEPCSTSEEWWKEIRKIVEKNSVYANLSRVESWTVAFQWPIHSSRTWQCRREPVLWRGLSWLNLKNLNMKILWFLCCSLSNEMVHHLFLPWQSEFRSYVILAQELHNHAYQVLLCQPVEVYKNLSKSGGGEGGGAGGLVGERVVSV